MPTIAIPSTSAGDSASTGVRRDRLGRHLDREHCFSSRCHRVPLLDDSTFPTPSGNRKLSCSKRHTRRKSRFKRFLNSTAISESIPKSKNPDSRRRRGRQPQNRLHFGCRKSIKTSTRSESAAPRNRERTSSADADAVAPTSSSEDRRSSKNAGPIFNRLLEHRPIRRHHNRSRRVFAHQSLKRPHTLLRREPSTAKCRPAFFDSFPAAPPLHRSPTKHPKRSPDPADLAHAGAASWSKKAFAAAWFDCPGLPITPTRLVNSVNISRSRPRVALCRCQAPTILGHKPVRNYSKSGSSTRRPRGTPTL